MSIWKFWKWKTYPKVYFPVEPPRPEFCVVRSDVVGALPGGYRSPNKPSGRAAGSIVLFCRGAAGAGGRPCQQSAELPRETPIVWENESQDDMFFFGLSSLRGLNVAERERAQTECGLTVSAVMQ